MTKDYFLTLRYLVSSEESRPGRADYWNLVFLPGKTPFSKHFMELSKVAMILSLSAVISMAISLL